MVPGKGRFRPGGVRIKAGLTRSGQKKYRAGGETAEKAGLAETARKKNRRGRDRKRARRHCANRTREEKERHYHCARGAHLYTGAAKNFLR